MKSSILNKQSYKKNCTKCSVLFVTKKKEDNLPPLCKKCELDEGVKARDVARDVKNHKE
jgi:hypothetical protein